MSSHPAGNREKTMRIRWEDGASIGVVARKTEVTISANQEGLLSLANILADLARQEPGAHVHLDEYNSLEDGSVELIIERT